MDWLTFTSKAIDSLAWPVAAIVLGLVFRRKLLDVISTLRKLKAGPVEAEFELATRQVLAGAADASSKKAASDVLQATSNESVESAAAKLLTARAEPTAAIIEGWSRLDGELHKLGRQTGTVVDPLQSQAKIYQEIMDADVLPTETKRLVQELRDLRNKVAHARVNPTPDSAQDYQVAVDRVIDLIRNYRKNLPGYTADVR